MPKASRIIQKFKKARSGREVTVTFDGLTITGLQGGLREDAVWQTQGYQDEYERSIWIDAAAFDDKPEALQAIIVDGTTRRILGVWPDSLGALIRLDIGGRHARN